ncbi:MAG TPA: histidine phosphatase family protein [Rhodoglobus sp.]|nr:histidine phosphatase family protein [Rhodoglobus sp.]
MVRLLLIRHGQTPSNVAGVLDTGIPGPGLTELGAEQAQRIPEALVGDLVDSIHVSRMVRTRLTAEPLAAALGIEPVELPGIHEIRAGDLEMRGDRDSIRVYLETAFAWGLGELDRRMPGGEDGHEFFQRFDEGIATVGASGADTAAVFSHGAAIRVWTAGRCVNVPPMFSGSHELDNTGIVELTGSPDEGWQLIAWQGTPVGGEVLADGTAEDPTGETLESAGADPA